MNPVPCSSLPPHRGFLNRLSRFLFTWPKTRRLLLGVAVLITLVAIIHVVENWRGRRAWAQCKRQLEAKGEVLDWSACVPAPVPDDQNIIKAPNMSEWFVKPNTPGRHTNELSEKLNVSALAETAKRNVPKEPLLLARLSHSRENAVATQDIHRVLRFDAPGANQQLASIVLEIVGPGVCSFQGIGSFVRWPWSQIKPRQIVLQTEKSLELADISHALPGNLIPGDAGRLQVEAHASPGGFRILLIPQPVLLAEEYLAWSDRAAPEFDRMREALQRPYIRLDDDYQFPFDIPIVHFVNIRNVAQTAAQRAQCCFLLGRSEQAFQELNLIFQLRQLLKSRPTTLVAAMIDVAIAGLCADTIADGLRLEAWRPTELGALQKILQQIKLAPALVDALRNERSAFTHTFETSTSREMAKVFSPGGSKDNFWARVTDPTFLLLSLEPRGWLYQNLATIAPLEQDAIEVFDVKNQLIQPAKSEAVNRRLERTFAHGSPYTFFASIALPNYTRATQTAARNQTKINQALVVCGLERYRYTHHRYPLNLEALVPEFVQQLPPDIIGGQPLKYRLTNDNQYVLYSMGWNEKDDHGERPPAPGQGRTADLTQGDWIWPSAAH